MPALAVADAYRRRRAEVEILFIGGQRGFAARLVPARGYRLEIVPSAPLFGVGPQGKARAVTQLLAGIRRARSVLRAERAQLVLGFGGYASAGTLIAARMLRIPSAIHEANALPGLTNRLLGRVVDRVFLGFESARAFFRAGKTVVTGMPTDLGISPAGTRELHMPARVLVLGGSMGSPFLNRAAPELLARVAARGVPLAVRHQSGEGAGDAVRESYRSRGTPAEVVGFTSEVASLYRWADLAITSAGAMTLAELATIGLPALLVPLVTASEDHQAANARAFAAVTGCRCLGEADWPRDAVVDHVVQLLTDRAGWAAASQRMRSGAAPEAAETIATACEAFLTRPA
jgi:UDP-N-acetylglucosamine--N-acetylmuramyl-(pentapeptide) pyrophosphoryl-undecaprenol N-acetylglucosamine transferase